MHYVVVDLEWNQAMSSKSSVFNKLPIHLRGEIIEIGAVKLNEDMSLGEEFTIDVKPGDLFAAYRGERVDGHDYIAAALERGAACCTLSTSSSGRVSPSGTRSARQQPAPCSKAAAI